MADICMCTNKECPQRRKCYRFMAFNNPYGQTVTNFQPEDGKCEFFYPIKNYLTRVTDDWARKKTIQLAPNKTLVDSIIIASTEQPIRVNSQRIQVLLSLPNLTKYMLDKLRRNFHVAKIVENEEGQMFLRTTHSNLHPKFYVITKEPLTVTSSQKYRVRIGGEFE